jgi:LCP family protein required for cell wall assembly
VLGIDSHAGLGAFDSTDSILLLHVETASGRAAMYGFPRNMTNVPLPAPWASAYDCGCFASGLSALLRTAVNAPSKFPKPGLSDTQRGLAVLEETIGGLAGVKVDGTLAVNMDGLVKLVDALGGVDVNVPARLIDKLYPKLDGSGLTTIDIPAGTQHMDGLTAVAYVRSRKSDSDYARMQRQQTLLKAMRAGFQPCAIVAHMRPILDALGDMLWTDLPVSTAPGLAALAEETSTTDMQTTVFSPQAGYPTAVTVDEVQKIQDAVAHGMAGAPSSGNSGGSAGPAC